MSKEHRICKFCGGPLNYVGTNQYRNYDLCSKCGSLIDHVLWTADDTSPSNIAFVHDTCVYNAKNHMYVPTEAKRKWNIHALNRPRKGATKQSSTNICKKCGRTFGVNGCKRAGATVCLCIDCLVKEINNRENKRRKQIRDSELNASPNQRSDKGLTHTRHTIIE